MLTKVEVENTQGSVLTLSVQNESNGYQIREISGLDPTKASVISSDFALLDGAQFQASRRETRNLMFTIGLSPNYGSNSAASLRAGLYGFFMPKTMIKLRFYMEGWPTVSLVGYVESLGSPMFSSDPVVTISVLCMEPNFMGLDSIIAKDPDLPEASIGFETKTSAQIVSGAGGVSIPYAGSIETGFLFSMTLAAGRVMLSGFSILRDLDTLVFVGELAGGDRVDISTVAGNKYAQVTRNGATTPVSVLYAISPNSDWLNLYPGPNDLLVKAEGDAISWQLSYYNRYGGL